MPRASFVATPSPDVSLQASGFARAGDRLGAPVLLLSAFKMTSLQLTSLLPTCQDFHGLRLWASALGFLIHALLLFSGLIGVTLEPQVPITGPMGCGRNEPRSWAGEAGRPSAAPATRCSPCPCMNATFVFVPRPAPSCPSACPPRPRPLPGHSAGPMLWLGWGESDCSCVLSVPGAQGSPLPLPEWWVGLCAK